MADANGTSGATPTWRQFNFFDQSEVKDVNDLASAPEAFRSLTPPYTLTSPHRLSPLSSTISCILSDSTGRISLLDRQLQVTKSWQAWDVNGTGSTGIEDIAGGGYSLGIGLGGKSKGKGKERGVMVAECGGVLIAIGEDDSPAQSQFPVLRIWDLLHEDKRTRGPVLMRNVRVGTGGRGYPVSCISMTSTLSYLAIGLVSGQALLYRHVAQSLSTSPLALSTFPKARVVWEGTAAEPITGLGFRDPTLSSSSSSNRQDSGLIEGDSDLITDKVAGSSSTGLFIMTTNKTIVIPVVTGKGSEPRVLEDVGAGLGCSTMDREGRELIVGRDDGIYIYASEGRGACYAYEGPKLSIHLYRQSIALLSPPFAPSSASHSATVRRAAATIPSAQSSGSSQSAKITIFDLKNKFVAHSAVMKEGMREIFGSGVGELFVIGGDGKIWRLKEASTSAKLEALYRRSLYQLAISLASSANVDESGVADIYVKYGDHLYNKGDFDGAVSQYVKTLGWLQPSYVIRKFLDAQRINNLTTYLQELHARGLANPDHTTLLLNCYTKTADKARLDAFIRSETTRSVDEELPFDLETAIRVCRQAGFYDHAVYLAKRYGRHEDYLRIQMDDAGNYGNALAYLRSLEPEVAAQNLTRYGKALLKNSSKETTDLLIDLCSGTLLVKRKQAAEAARRAANTVKKDASAPSGNYLSYLGVDQLSGVFGAGLTPDAPPAEAQSQDDENQAKIDKHDASLQYTPPSSRRFFAEFVDHPSEFIRFLESVASQRWKQRLAPRPVRKHSHLQKQPLDISQPTTQLGDAELDQQSIWNTLLELYLTNGQAESDSASGSTPSQQRASLLLDQADDLPLDPMHALILCSSYDFKPGLIILWERLGMYEDVLRFWMQASESQTDGESAQVKTPTQHVLYYLTVYGPSNPHLYPIVLRYLTSSTSLLSRHAPDVRDILNVIDTERIMPPLAVIQQLSRNGVTSIGVIKDWLKAKVADTRQDIDSDKQLVKSYRSETEEKLKEIANLADVDKPQVFQVTRCASCGGQLDLPSVHFMCKHSYHQRCLPDSDPECPSCARQYAIIREIRRNQEAMADQHDLFVSEVQEADDGFAVIAGAYGRGLLNSKVRDA